MNTQTVKENYFENIIRETYIQQWFSGEPVTQESAVDCIIESYPLPIEMSREMIEEWVENEVNGYNYDMDDCNKLPTRHTEES